VVAVRASAGAISTANLKDLPAKTLEPYGIKALHRDDSMRDLLDLDRPAVLQLRDDQARLGAARGALRAALEAATRAAAPPWSRTASCSACTRAASPGPGAPGQRDPQCPACQALTRAGARA